MPKKTKTLVLDRNWMPFAVCGHYNALCKVFADRARIQEVSLDDRNPVLKTNRLNHPVDNLCPVCLGSKINAIGMTSARVCSDCGLKFKNNDDGFLEIFKPSVIVMKHYSLKHKNNVRFTSSNLFARDGHVCAYCGETFSRENLTVDHIVPKAHKKFDVKNGGGWMNCITACKPCNNRKGNRTPQEANMKMLYEPYVPKYAPQFYIKKDIKFADSTWWDFLGRKEDWVR